LKLQKVDKLRTDAQRVAPHAGAWVETEMHHSKRQSLTGCPPRRHRCQTYKIDE